MLLFFFYQAGLLGLVLSETKIHDKCTFSSRWFSNNCVTGKSFSSVQSLSHVRLFETPWTAACQASLSITNSCSLLKLMSITSVMPLTISSSVMPFPFHLQSLPATGSFPVSQFFTSGGQSVEASASASVLPMNIQD